MTPAQTRFANFVNARELARLTYENTGVKGISLDPLLKQYRFCNVNREHDAVTVWIRKHVREPLDAAHADMNYTIFCLALCRVFNEPDTLKNLLLCRQDWQKVLRTLCWFCREATDSGIKIMRGAYLIVSHGDAGKGIPAWEYYAGALADVAMTDFTDCGSMAEVAQMLDGILGFSDFLSNQILTDFRYMRESEPYADRWTFVLCGPGTRRGINRWNGLVGKDAERSVPSAVGTNFILNLREDLEFLSYFDQEIINHFQDPNNLSNCFCEWDKHERALETIALGGKPHLKRF